MKKAILLLWLTAAAVSAVKKPLHFTVIAPVENELAPIVVPVVDSALERINSEVAILPQYTLKHGGIQHSGCDHRSSLDAFFSEVPPEPVDVAILGGTCSKATKAVAEIVQYWNISLVSYAPWAPASTDDSANHFRMYPPIENLVHGVSSLLHHYGWKRISIITEEEESSRFLQTEEALTTGLANENISVIMATHIERNMKLTDLDYGSDVRIFFLNVRPQTARKLMCKAHTDGMHYPRYVWITYGWYDDDWYRAQSTDDAVEDVECTVQQLSKAVNGAIIIQHYPTASDINAPTMTGISPEEFHVSMAELQEHSFLSALAYDAVCVIAMALNRTMNMIDNGDISGTGCEDLEGALVDLDQFSYSNAKMGCLIRYSLENTDFRGISGQVQFSNGSRVQSALKILQYKESTGGHLDRINMASVNVNNDFEFSYVSDESDATVFPGGVPQDGTPVKAINVQPLWLVIPYYTLSTFGIIFAGVCLLFNVVFRKRRIVRLTSPNLNYFIVAGGIFLYGSIYFRLVPTPNKTYQYARCNLQAFLGFVGYVLCFAPVLVKMWRVYYIFHNPSPNKKAVKDWHLTAAVLGFVGIILFMAIASVAIPQLRPDLKLRPDKERPEGKTDDGVTINKCAWECYNKAPPFIWLSLEFVYMAVLQVMAVILAFKTRKVKIKALNDSKSVTAIIYTTSIVLAGLAIITFALNSYIVVTEVLFSGGIILATTVFVSFVFIPKMRGLHRDPKGQTIFEKSNPTGSTIESGIFRTKSDDAQATIETLTAKIKELETDLSKYKVKLLPVETASGESSEPLDQHSGKGETDSSNDDNNN